MFKLALASTALLAACMTSPSPDVSGSLEVEASSPQPANGDSLDHITISLEGNAQTPAVLELGDSSPFSFTNVAPGRYHLHMQATHDAFLGPEVLGDTTTGDFEVPGDVGVDVGQLVLVWQPET